MLTVRHALLLLVAVLLSSCRAGQSKANTAKEEAIKAAILERLTGHLTRSPDNVGGDPSAILVSVQMRGGATSGKATFECAIKVPLSSRPPNNLYVHEGFWREHLTAISSLDGTAELDAAGKPTQIKLTGQTTSGPFEYDIDVTAGHFNARYSTPTGVVVLTKFK